MTLIHRARPDYFTYMHSPEWFRRRRHAFVFWTVVWAAVTFAAMWALMATRADPLATAVPVGLALGSLAQGRKVGHHWRGYAHLGREHVWDILPVSRLVNHAEQVIRRRLHMKAFPATLLALAAVGVWPVWAYLAVRATIR